MAELPALPVPKNTRFGEGSDLLAMHVCVLYVYVRCKDTMCVCCNHACLCGPQRRGLFAVYAPDVCLISGDLYRALPTAAVQ